MGVFSAWVLPVDFPARLIHLRKAQGYTQQVLANAIGLHVNQIKKYEAGSAQPTLPVLVKLAQRLHVSLDALVFAEGERGPDERLKLQFEAICQLDPKEREALETVIAGVLHMHDAKRWTRAEQSA